MALAAQKRTDEALAAYGRALEIEPRSAEVHYNRGNAYFEQGKLEPAVEAWSQAIEIEPRFARAYQNRAAAYRRLGQDALAQADIERAAALGRQVEAEGR
jgi:tetratricopeptide (TPR) repeat protein